MKFPKLGTAKLEQFRRKEGRRELFAVGQFDREASPSRRLLCRKVRDTPRGSHRFFAVQRTLAQDDNQTDPLPIIFRQTPGWENLPECAASLRALDRAWCAWPSVHWRA